MSAWSVKIWRRALSRHFRDARVYGHTTTVMHDNEYTPPQLGPANVGMRRSVAKRLGPCMISDIPPQCRISSCSQCCTVICLWLMEIVCTWCSCCYMSIIPSAPPASCCLLLMCVVVDCSVKGCCFCTYLWCCPCHYFAVGVLGLNLVPFLR